MPFPIAFFVIRFYTCQTCFALKEHPLGYIKNQKVYRKGFRDIPEKIIGEVRENENQSIQYFLKRFEIAENKVASIEKQIEESDNKGSFLMKLIHLKEKLTNFPAIGNFEELMNRLEEKEIILKNSIVQNRIKNLEIKGNFLNELETLQGDEDFRKTSESVRNIRNKWIQTGEVIEDQREAVEKKFQSLVSAFYERRKIENNILNKKHKQFLERADSLIDQTNFEKKKLLLEKAKRITSQTDTNSVKQINALKKEWKKIPKLGGDEATNISREFLFVSQEISELRFINDLVKKKHKAYDDFPEIIKTEKKIKVLKNLLYRDENDLRLIKMNKENIKSDVQAFNLLIDSKIIQQENNIAIKQKILNDLNVQWKEYDDF